MLTRPKKNVVIKMHRDLYEKLAELSAAAGQPLTAYIRQVLRHYIWHVEYDPDFPESWPVK